MQNRFHKYFWDGEQNLSDKFKLTRILEYASFPDLIAYPFEDIKKFLPDLNLDHLRTSEKRIEFLKVIRPFLANSNNWDEVFDRLIAWRKNISAKPLAKLESIAMRPTENKALYGWDDEKIYFWDEEFQKEWCISDEEQLYNQLVQICREYFSRSRISNSRKK